MPLDSNREVVASGCSGQVFWLTDRSTGQAFPSSLTTVAGSGVRPRLQRRVRDGISPSSLLRLLRAAKNSDIHFSILEQTMTGCEETVKYNSKKVTRPSRRAWARKVIGTG